jgi:hypothetical protein
MNKNGGNCGKLVFFRVEKRQKSGFSLGFSKGFIFEQKTLIC